MTTVTGIIVAILMFFIMIVMFGGVFCDNKKRKENKPDPNYIPPPSIIEEKIRDRFIEVKNVKNERIMLNVNEIKSIQERLDYGNVKVQIETEKGYIFVVTRYEEVIRQLLPKILIKGGLCK